METKYFLIVNANTGVPIFNYGFAEDQKPSVIPEQGVLVSFDSTAPNFSILHGLLFEDPDKVAVEYKLPAHGGIVYDFNSKIFTVNKADTSINIEVLRSLRDKKLAETDLLTLTSDMPAEIMAELLQYRQSLRDITNKVGTEWTSIYQIVWPEYPQKLIIKPVAV